MQCKKLIEIEDGNNRVFILSRNNGVPLPQTSDDAVSNSNMLESMLKKWNVQNRAAWTKDMGMLDHIKEIKNIDQN